MQMRVNERGVPGARAFLTNRSASLGKPYKQARIELELIFMHRKMDNKILWPLIAHSIYSHRLLTAPS
jgi:hypothetical protein